MLCRYHPDILDLLVSTSMKTQRHTCLIHITRHTVRAIYLVYIILVWSLVSQGDHMPCIHHTWLVTGQSGRSHTLYSSYLSGHWSVCEITYLVYIILIWSLVSQGDHTPCIHHTSLVTGQSGRSHTFYTLYLSGHSSVREITYLVYIICVWSLVSQGNHTPCILYTYLVTGQSGRSHTLYTLCLSGHWSVRVITYFVYIILIWSQVNQGDHIPCIHYTYLVTCQSGRSHTLYTSYLSGHWSVRVITFKRVIKLMILPGKIINVLHIK